ncbi:MAG: putative lysophospholipase L1 biosynthesis ABC-type transport system permease subunit [Paraglaciecola sp.]
MILFNIAWQRFIQQFKARENMLWLITIFSLMFYLLIAAFASSSIQHYLKINLQHMMGASTLVTSDVLISPDVEQQLQQYSTKLVRTQQFRITLTHKNHWQSVDVKAVEQHYPLQGKVTITGSLGAPERQVANGPAKGEIWLDSRALVSLAVKVGDKIQLGAQSFSVSAVLLFEPDRLLESHSLNMRAMINLQDSVLLDQVKKRQYRYLLDNSHQQQNELAAKFKKNYPHIDVLTSASGNHPLSALWFRIYNFIGLSSILLFLLGILAIDLTRRKLVQKEKHFVAVASSCGMSRRQGLIISMFVYVIGVTFMLALGIIAAVVCESVVMQTLQMFFPEIQSNWQIVDLIKVSLICLTILTLNQLPSWFAIMKVEVIELLNNKDIRPSLSVDRILFPALSLLTLVYFYSDNLLLTSSLLAALGFCLLLLIVVTWLFLFLGEVLVPKSFGLLSFSIYLMRKRLFVKSSQIIGIGLSLTLFIVSNQISDNFLGILENVSIKNSGNLIISQADQNDVLAIQRWATKTNSELKPFRQFSYGKLTQINHVNVAEHIAQPSESSAKLSASIRLSWSQDVPVNNEIISGQWQNIPQGEFLNISVEDEVAEDLNIQLGDLVTINIQNQNHHFQVNSVHTFVPGKSPITFWFQLPINDQTQHIFMQTPLSMGGADLPESAWESLAELWEERPSLKMVPLKEVAKKVGDFIDIGTGVILVFGSFIGLMSSLVIISAICNSVDNDKKRNGLILSFGLTKIDCIKVICLEWMMTAVIVTTGAVFASWLALTLVYQVQFSIEYQTDFVTIVTLLTENTLGLTILGLTLSYASLQVSTLDLLNPTTSKTRPVTTFSIAQLSAMFRQLKNQLFMNKKAK